MKLLNLLHVNQFEMSAPKCLTHYSPVGNGDMLDIVVHKNVQLSEFIVPDILDSDYLSIAFPLLKHVKTRNLSDPVVKFTDWEQTQSLVLKLISPRIHINSGEEANKAACDFTVSIASA
jgi:hypothetical protein